MGSFYFWEFLKNASHHDLVAKKILISRSSKTPIFAFLLCNSKNKKSVSRDVATGGGGGGGLGEGRGPWPPNFNFRTKKGPIFSVSKIRDIAFLWVFRNYTD